MLEKPHCGNCLLPFMNRTTLLSDTYLMMASLSSSDKPMPGSEQPHGKREQQQETPRKPAPFNSDKLGYNVRYTCRGSMGALDKPLALPPRHRRVLEVWSADARPTVPQAWLSWQSWWALQAQATSQAQQDGAHLRSFKDAKEGRALDLGPQQRSTCVQAPQGLRAWFRSTQLLFRALGLSLFFICLLRSSRCSRP